MIKNTPLPEEIEKVVETKIIAEIGEGGYLGYCHKYWAVKKRILKEEYGIDWLSPAEKESGVSFD